MGYTADDEHIEGSAAFDPKRIGAETVRKPVTELAVIDVSPFRRDSTAVERRRVGEKIREACIDMGFFYITGHDFSSAELDETLRWGHRFFELPFDDKMRIAARNNAANLGFIQTGGLNPEGNASKHPDLKERLYLSRELAPGEIEDPMSPAGKSQWPDTDLLPGFAASIKHHTAKKLELARMMTRAFALSLELPEPTIEQYHDRMGCIHSFNYYPATPVDQDSAWGFSPHTDYGSFTILHQDGNGGLQARNASGQWIEVPPIPGTFVVNVGDLLARWTNDLYVSALHRVVNRNSTARLSISFFAYPNPRAVIRPMETCVSARHPSRYEPVIAGEYIAELLGQAHRTGRTGVSTRTAERL